MLLISTIHGYDFSVPLQGGGWLNVDLKDCSILGVISLTDLAVFSIQFLLLFEGIKKFPNEAIMSQKKNFMVILRFL